MKTKSRRPVTKNNALIQNAKNASAEKAQPIEEIILQFDENEVSVTAISEKVRLSYKESGSKEEVRDIKIYVKPQDNKAYYVINGENEGSVDLI